MQVVKAIDSFLVGYFSTHRRSPRTETAYALDLAQFREYFGGSASLEAVDADCLEAWAMELVSRDFRPASIRRKFATLKVLFTYWVRKGVLDHSPFWKIRLDLEREQPLPRNISMTDAKSLLEQAWSKIERRPGEFANTRDRRFLSWRDVAAIEVLFATGIRVGELVSLTLRDWNEEEGSFIVKGKGARERLALLTDSRSSEAVKTYVRHRRRLNLGHEWLLVNAAGGRLSSQGVGRALSRLAMEAGLSIHLTPHMIRHTVATLLLRNGADIRVVQELLGHSSIAMTQRYTHVSKEHLRASLRMHHPNRHLAVETHAQATLCF